MSIKKLPAMAQSTYRIEKMDCPVEEALIRKKIEKMEGIYALHFNLLERRLTVEHAPGIEVDLDRALASLQLGDVREREASAEDVGPVAPPRQDSWWPLLTALLLALASEGMELFMELPFVSAGLAVAAILLTGIGTFVKGWIALKNRTINMNALMSVAVSGAALIGQWPEAAMVMALFTLAERIEDKSITRARNAIRGLLALSPETAHMRREDGAWVDMESKHVPLDAVVRVLPGERIPLDGSVQRGHSFVDQSPITGESIPVEKTIGDVLFAGTINQGGVLEYRVTATTQNSTLARIIHAVEEAQQSRAPTQRFVDVFARYYTPAVFALAVGVALIPPLFMGGAWLAWIYKALVMLVIACPCALVISTPVSIVSGLTTAARKGILIKGGIFLELGRRLSHLALDKTGTLTIGKPVQTDRLPCAQRSETDSLRIAVSLAGHSTHPVSKAIAAGNPEALAAGYPVEQFEELPGKGSRGIIGGHTWHLGNQRMAKELGVANGEQDATIARLEQEGKSVVMLMDASGIAHIFAVADTVKASSVEAIRQLHAMGIRTTMLTGDNRQTAAIIAKAAGVDDLHSELLPEEKAAVIAQLARQGMVGMVGDGINDAPALAKADIGFAMGSAGTDTAIESAGISIMNDDLLKIPVFIRLSRFTHAILVQNITLALGIKALFLILTFAGRSNMWMAVFADMGTSLLVIANSLRILRR